jgi:hypothetical protein
MAKRKGKNHRIPGFPNSNKIDGKPDEVMEIFLKFLVDSDILADEPEFIDFRFDTQKAQSCAERTIKKHARELSNAEKEGREELSYVQEKLLIEVIDQLLSPEIRQDLINRIDLLQNRLEVSKADFEKLAMVAALKTAFESNDFPWGMVNLTVELFKRSLKNAKPDPDIAQLYEQVQALIGEDLDEEEFLEKIGDPEFVKKLETEIDTNSDLFQRVAKQAEAISEDFIHAIFHGQVELDLFTVAELTNFLKRVQERVLVAELDPSKYGSPEVVDVFKVTINEYIYEILTPDRLKTMKEKLQGITKTWLKEGNVFAGALLNETNNLDQETLAENLFIKTSFLSQLRRATREKESEDSRSAKKSRRRRRRRKE